MWETSGSNNHSWRRRNHTEKMGNASETSIISKISKEHDFLLGMILTIFVYTASQLYWNLGCAFSLMGNAVLLLVAYQKKSSLKPAEFFIVNLSISDLGMTISLFPFAISSAFSHRWLFTESVCLFYAFCGVLFGLCSLSNLTVLSSVCWFKVCRPNYGNKFSSSHAMLLVVGVWCFSAIFAVGPLSGWGQYSYEPYGTACCIDWFAPHDNLLAMSYIICLFFFCYIVPCTIIFLSYAFILVTVRGSQQAVQQHMSLQNKLVNAQTHIIKLSVAVCVGFLVAWSPYAAVSMWAAFVNQDAVPPIAFATVAVFAKSSTLYNPLISLGFKPNFRRSLRRWTLCLCLCRREMVRKNTDKENCHFTHTSNGHHTGQ
ncbi:opsin 7, group member b isoform X2 [Neoarius graeffei]|uniref:opsin 7, group member b isoform X2 n=1 Tax=Neoarius graeffei TaxID=443677 RepID=UPI00298CE8B3|nr:opsin 7, group member b isoform X2 [Neoarius graeffei]